MSGAARSSWVVAFALAALSTGCESAPPASIVAPASASQEAGGDAGASSEPARLPGEHERLQKLTRRIADNPAESILFWSPEERRVAFKNLDALAPTRRVAAGDEVYELAEAPLDLDGVAYTLGRDAYTLADFVALPESIGILVVQDDTILFERYAEGNDRNSRWISFSITKSITSMLIGAAIQDGFIESVDEPVVDYLPRLRGTAYDGATIEHVLQMSSGVAWDENYADPSSDVSRAGAANGLKLLRYLGELEREHEPGAVFHYNTGETNLAGDILRSAIGNNASEYLSHKIWRAFGMEADALWLLGEPGGGETGGCCLNATLRDYARIGLFAMNDGRLPDGTRVLPEGWMKASTTGSKGASFYGYLWWLNRDESYQAIGIFGQHS